MTDKTMFKDLKNWCEEGVVYLKCKENSGYFDSGVEYLVDEVVERNDYIWLHIDTGEIGKDDWISTESNCFDLVFK